MLAALFAAALLQPPAAAAARVTSIDRPETATAGPALEVTSTTAPAGGFLPLSTSGYGKNLSPSVQWSRGPAATRSYVLIVEDSDAGDGRPLLHWLAYDIGPDETHVKDKTKNIPRLKEEPVFSQGPNDHGGIGWTGPHPPEGDPPHHYHVEVFALDRKSLGKPGLGRDDVLSAMRGHVVAKGQMIALYEQKPDKVRKPKDDKTVKAAPQ